MEKSELVRHLSEAILQLVLVVAIVVLFGMGINYYVGFGVLATIMYLNMTKEK